MAVLITTTLPAAAAVDHAEWHERNRSLPQHEGFLFQCDGPTEGGWQIVSAWESQAAFQRYFDAEVRPNMPAGDAPRAEMKVLELSSFVSK